MKKSITNILFILVFVSGSSYGSGWSSTGETADLRVFGGEFVLATLSSLTSSDNQENCGNTQNPRQFSFLLEEIYSQHLLSMLLSAEMGGRSIQVYLTGNCIGNRPEINGVRITG
ncbi:MAG: hypothetical protein GY816_06620 [Cytophagales bacterium]|nr:hypothetical protein [Cytophagales bacterium]